MTPVRIEPARSLDLDSLCSLLAAASLPTDGFREHLRTALVARDPSGLIGCVALEQYGDLALLRSLAVTPSHRGVGVGQQLSGAALDLARRRRVAAVYLLTTTAADFFSRHFGFQPIARAAVPEPVRQSIEFMSACPQTAQAMVREIEP
jgi:amino-acid N-acetyltransferase